MRTCKQIGLVAVLLFATLAPSAPAAEKFGNALDWVPADATFYTASLNWGEQIERIGNSNAWQKFRAIPSIAMAWQMAEAKINDPSGPAAIPLQMMQLPENQQLLQMFGDMFSGEIVFYGGPRTLDFIELYAELQAANTVSKLEARAGGMGDLQRVRARSLLETLQENRELLKLPELVVAFQLKDAAAAKTQLKRLEVIAGMGLNATPIGDRFKRQQVGDAEYLTLSLDGSLLPLDNVPWDKWEEEPGEFQELRGTLEKLTLVVSLGVRGNYLLLSIDESTAGLAKLGSGPVLGDLNEFQPLGKYKDRQLVAVSYVSQKLAERASYTAADIDDLEEQFGSLLEMAGVEDETLQDRIATDIEALGDDLKRYISKPGASMRFAFLTPTGFEGYGYNWGENLTLDASRPLPLTGHVGGNPLLALVTRTKPDPDAYNLLIKWGKTLFGYVEEYAVPQWNADKRDRFKQVMQIANPLLARADKATREQLLPATQDGQLGFVLDAKAASKQWQQDMPAHSEPLPMAELAVVVGVNDPAKFKAAFAEYRAILAELIEQLNKLDDKGAPLPALASPEAKAIDGGELYVYHLPQEAQVDRQIALTGGIGSDLAVAATTPALAERILHKTPLQSAGLLSSEAAGPCGSVVYFNWPMLVDAVTPWIDFAVRQNTPGADAEDTEKVDAAIQTEFIMGQVRQGLEILKCWRSSESVTTMADGVVVTHTRTIFEDLK